jgi:hypothetical protein
MAEKLTIETTNLRVRAGMILICDSSYLVQCEGDLALAQTWRIPNGTYNVEWIVPERGSGSLKGSAVIKISSGSIVAADPGDCIKNDLAWTRWLKKTRGGELSEAGTIIIRTQADAIFTLSITLTRL